MMPHLRSRRLVCHAVFTVILAIALLHSPGRASDPPERIEGPAIARALETFYDHIDDKHVEDMALMELINPNDPPLASRYPGARIHLLEDLPIDPVLATPNVNISVFLESEDHLSAELWKVYFAWDRDGWTPDRFQALIRAEVGDRFLPDENNVYKFDELTIKREAIEFHITNGYVIPAASVGLVGRVAIFGNGRYVFTVTDPVERHQLNKYAKNEGNQLTGTFSEMALVISHQGYLDLIEGAALEQVKHRRMYKNARDLIRRVDKDYMMRVKPLKEEWAFRPTTRDFLKAEFNMPSGNWLVYSYNPFEQEQVTLTQKSGFPRNFRLKPPIVWCHFRAAETPSVLGTGSAQLHIERYGIEGELRDNKKTLEFKTLVEVLALDDSVAVASFILDKAADVRRVDYADGEGALHIHQGDYLSIPLRTPLQKGERTSFTFWYGGDLVRQPEPAFYTPLKNEEWLPRHSDRDAFHFDLTMRVPKSLTVITTGSRVAEDEEDDIRISRWQSTRRLNLLGLTFSDYRAVSRTFVYDEKDEGINVTLYAKKELLGSQSREKEILETIDETLPFYSESFGKYPYQKLDIMQMPDTYTYGQGLPTLLMLWGLYFRSDYILDRDLPVNDYFRVQKFFKNFLAHELAHQWWGNVVVPRTYRDAWLSEGLATYAADLFIENAVGRPAFQDLLKDHVFKAQQSDHEGAISLGQRLKGAYQPIVYDKGALVLHMLRQVCGDEKFYTILNMFYHRASKTLVATRDFQKVAEEIMERDMSWFFNQWLQDTGYPEYRLDYTSMRQDDAQYRIQCTLSQQQKGRLFTMPVPIRIVLKNGGEINELVWNTGRYQTFEVVVSDEVAQIIPAPDYAIYCSAEVKGW